MIFFFFVKIAINEKGEIFAIPMMTIMTMISPIDKKKRNKKIKKNSLYLKRVALNSQRLINLWPSF